MFSYFAGLISAVQAYRNMVYQRQLKTCHDEYFNKIKYQILFTVDTTILKCYILAIVMLIIIYM